MRKLALLGFAAAVMLAPGPGRAWGWEVEEEAYGSSAADLVEPAPPAAEPGAASLEPTRAVEADEDARSEAAWLASVWTTP
jgi:hypothetical protein